MRNILTSIATILLLTGGAYASFRSIPLKDTIKNCHVVVIGKIGKVERTDNDKNHGKLDVAHIVVSKVLKNVLSKHNLTKGSTIALTMPNNGESIDIVYKEGTTGVWILEFKEKRFWAPHPNNLQAKDKEEEVVQIIKQQNKK